MYHKKQQHLTMRAVFTVPKNNQDIKNIDKNKKINKHDYETIRNIVLEKSNKKDR